MSRPPIPPSVGSNLKHFFAFGFGLGALPYAPGTFGTLLGVLIYSAAQGLPLWLYIVHTAFFFGLGVWLCHGTARDLGVHDHPGIVWDEVVGYLITMTAAPKGWGWIILGFVLFRLFDIWKPWPISLIDRRVKGGLGIMLDDALAALYAGVILQAAALILR
ncbi:MAG: phosphatidylglycerophosphatase A [Gammaproteobacteria bacterium]